MYLDGRPHTNQPSVVVQPRFDISVEVLQFAKRRPRNIFQVKATLPRQQDNLAGGACLPVRAHWELINHRYLECKHVRAPWLQSPCMWSHRAMANDVDSANCRRTAMPKGRWTDLLMLKILKFTHFSLVWLTSFGNCGMLTHLCVICLELVVCGCTAAPF